jgi:heterodisulfide reductase subunit A-like polyferredoxin
LQDTRERQIIGEGGDYFLQRMEGETGTTIFYGKDPRVLTQVEFARKMADDPSWAQGIKRVAMIQCVGSRNEQFSACSRVCCSAAVKILCRETMQTLAAVAEVDPEKCVACLACVRECPFHVPIINKEGVSEISPTGVPGLRSVHRRMPETGHQPQAQQG